jgi:hypothetical protein
MAKKIGIENLEIVGGFACGIVNDVLASLADGKINFADAPRFVDDLFKVPGMIKAVPGVDEEWLDIDEAETVAFETFVVSRLTLPENLPVEVVKDVIKAVITIIMRASSMTKAVMNLVEKIKALKP